MRTMTLPFKIKDGILACGADLKSKFCFTKGGRLYISDDFGDLSRIDNMENYEKAMKEAIRVYKVRPKIIACDIHPGYFSTKFAQNYAANNPQCVLYKVQHHYAHIASCMLDNGIKGKVIGVSFDGTGFGTDDNIWGSEILLADLRGFKRMAHLDYIPMPGGESAVREPWRMAFSYLYKTYNHRLFNLGIPFMKKIGREKSSVLSKMIMNKINSPLTSSMGRLFDGVSSILGVCDKITYEAEAAIELERIADVNCEEKYAYKIQNGFEDSAIRIGEIIRGIVNDIKRNEKNSIISAKFHNTIAHFVKDAVSRIKKKEGTSKVVFSGGVFQNKYLVMRVKEFFSESEYKIYFHNVFPPTDVCIALGQIAVAGGQSEKGRR